MSERKPEVKYEWGIVDSTTSNDDIRITLRRRQREIRREAKRKRHVLRVMTQHQGDMKAKMKQSILETRAKLIELGRFDPSTHNSNEPIINMLRDRIRSMRGLIRQEKNQVRVIENAYDSWKDAAYEEIDRRAEEEAVESDNSDEPSDEEQDQ